MPQKKTMKGGSSCGAPVERKMTGGNKSKKSKKSAKKMSKGKLGVNEARCMKCRMNVTMVDPEPYEVKNSKRVMKMMRGTCPKCGGKVFKIVGN